MIHGRRSTVPHTPFVYLPLFAFKTYKQLKHGSQRVTSLELQHSASEDGLGFPDFLHWSNDEHLHLAHRWKQDQ